jgi:acyl-CoA synthetase (AMP-forming)/AMP-acid ligase II
VTEQRAQREQAAAAQRQAVERDPAIRTLAAAIRAAAERPATGAAEPGIVLLDSRGEPQRLSHADLWVAARRTAAAIRERGAQRGDRIILMLPTGEAHLVNVCAAMLLGILPCTVAAPLTRGSAEAMSRHFSHIYQKLAPALVLVPSHLQALLQENPVLDARRIVTPEDLHHETPLAVAALPALDPGDPLHIQLTSGSTSTPKGVVLSHGNAIANLQGIARAMEFDPRADRILSWLPFYHDMGFVQLLFTLYYQSGLVLMTPSTFLRQPLSWLQEISRHRIALTAAPTFAYRLCVQKHDPAKLDGVDLSSWRRAFVGAEPVPFGILDEFTRTFRPYGLSEDTLYPCYGMAETVLATTLPMERKESPNHRFGFVAVDRIDPGQLRRDGRAAAGSDGAAPEALEVVSMGQAVAGLELRVQDADGQALPERAVGEICVRGTSLMEGYYQDPEATAAAVRDGWYHTGDRGYEADGELYVLGRIKELLIVRGRNYEPHDVEATIEEHEAVRGGYTVAFGVYNPQRGTDEVIAIVETRAAEEARPLILQEIQQSLQQTFGFIAHEIVFARHGSIPRTTSGKRQRVLSREWYVAGKFAAGRDEDG